VERVSWKATSIIVRSESSSASANCGTVFDYDHKSAEIRQIEAAMAAPGFWDKPAAAQDVVGRLKSLRTVVAPLAELGSASGDLDGLLEMGESDPALVSEIVGEIERLERLLDDVELNSLLTGRHDEAGAIVSIFARDGGTDANDWAEMLLRMYTQWAQKSGYHAELLDRQDNPEAGIQSASLAIRGPHAYGVLKGETGVHRLVRISPYNAEGKRQTSFAAVDVTPEISDSVEVQIDEKDVRVDTYRASGAGGQHVNKTDSAVRLTHLPTGIVVQCQNERSQHKNRAIAWKMLRAQMARVEEEKREAEEATKYQNKARVGFGNQIRNYFLHPDQRVKDARTGYSMGSFHQVLDGDIQGFLDAYLRWRVKTEANTPLEN
jgi:peptide chain release factor 2